FFSVLANPPTFRFKAAVLCSVGKNRARNSQLALLLRKKELVVLPDDFGSGVTLQALGASIPGYNNPIGIEHIDRDIGNRVQKKLYSLFLRQISERLEFGRVVHRAGLTKGREGKTGLLCGGRQAEGAVLAPRAQILVSARKLQRPERASRPKVQGLTANPFRLRKSEHRRSHLNRNEYERTTFESQRPRRQIWSMSNEDRETA